MGLAPLAFSGLSAYSADFQTILKRAKDIASIPLERLQNESADTLQKKTVLDGLRATVAGLGSSLRVLGEVGSKRALTASSSNTAAATVQNTGATAPAVYTINEVSKLAKAASETTLTGYADSTSAPVSSTGTVKLIYGAREHTITLGAGKNNLAGLRDAINALGAGVSATVITTGTGATPNYLTLNVGTTGATTLRLVDDPTGAATELLTASNQGQDAEFQINGAAVKRSANVVNDVVSGLTFTLTGTTASAFTLSLASDRRQVSTALQSLVTNYNGLVADVGLQVGETAGLLSGDHLIHQIQESLRRLSSYRDESGAVKSLIDLGVSFGQDGTAAFDPSVFDRLPDSTVSAALTFLGSETTGLGALAEQFEQFSDPVTGLIRLQQDGYTAEDKRLQEQIAVVNERIAAQQRALAEKLQIADALLGRLASQQSVLDATIQSLNYSLFGKKEQ